MQSHALVGLQLMGGKYEVTAFIGRGGMSEVYEGTDTRFGRKVAVKVLNPGFAVYPYYVRRFREEAETAASVEHPNVAKIYDIQEEDDLCYCVMQYLPGGLASKLKQRGTIPFLEAVRIIRPVADALAGVHNCGIVHRDIKPGNIMFDEHDNPVLTDFGIALRDDTTRLQGAVAIGTTEYMSPEQVRGENTDFRSDLYSLGIVLYELLTGSVPFQADDPQVVFYQHLRKPVPERPLQQHKAPRRARELLRRCLAKSPGDRFQSTEALVEALEDALDNPPTLRLAASGLGVGRFRSLMPSPARVLASRIVLALLPHPAREAAARLTEQAEEWLADPVVRLLLRVFGGMILLLFVFLLVSVAVNNTPPLRPLLRRLGGFR